MIGSPPNIKTETERKESDNIDPKVLDQLIKEGQPNYLTWLFVDRPFWVLLLGYIVLSVLTFTSFALGYFDLTPQHNREYLIWDDQKVIDWDKQVAGKDTLLAAQGKGELPIRMQNTQWWNPVILVKTSSEDDNLLEKSNLLKIQEIETKIMAMKDWPLFCKAKAPDDKSCSDDAILSPLLYLKAILGEKWTEKSQDELDMAWKAYRNNEQLWSTTKLLFNKESMIDKTGKVNYMRFLVFFGAPLDMSTKQSLDDDSKPGPRYKDLTDREKDQMKYASDFQQEIVALLDQFNDNNKDGIVATLFSESVIQVEFQKLVERDTTFAVFSVIFVIMYFTFHLESLFLAINGMMIIGYSFSLTAIVYQGVFRIDYVSNLHNLVIFIVLGIAADNIFVFVDAWRQSAHIEVYNGNLTMRMSYAWRRAVRAIAVTSATTTVAFLANVMSPMMPIISFGIYAAIIIQANYFLVILVYPPAVIIYENHFAKYQCLCFCLRESKKSSGQDLTAEAVRSEDVIGDPDTQIKKEPKIQVFFREPWNKYVHKFRYVIIVVFTVWGFFAAYYASQLGPLTDEEDFVADDHPIRILASNLKEKFDNGGDQGFKIYLFWGVKDIDKSDTYYWDATYVGKGIMDPDFDLSSEDAQKSILQFCQDLRKQEFVVNGFVKCWLEVFQQWVKLTKQRDLPLPPEDFNKFILEFRQTAYGFQLEKDLTIGFIDDKLAFFELESESIGDKRWAYEDKHPIYLKWQGFVDDFKKTAPEQLQSATQTGGMFWGYMETERAFLQSATTGMAAAGGFSFIVLLIASRNIILSILAIVSVAFVIVSVVAIMVFKGWELGISESIAIVIMIGLAVDYVVHLAADYKHSVKGTRFEKIKQAYSEMGISILSGTITTITAGLPLFGGKLITFRKFGVIITSTISISFLSSMLFFGALCHVIGPQDQLGDIQCCLKGTKVEDKETARNNRENQQIQPRELDTENKPDLDTENKNMVLEDI